MSSSLESVLVLISGEESADDPSQALSFVTRAQDLSFTSCSGILLPDGGSGGRLVLIPASSLARWLKPGAKWSLTSRSTAPPPLAPGCAVCAAGSVALGSGRAALLVPIATFSVPAAQRAASALLHGLNRDATSDAARWNFAWSIAATAEASPAEQGAPFGCLAPFHFLNAHVNGAIACSFPPPHQHQHQPTGAMSGAGTAPAATTAAPPALASQQLQPQLQLQPALYALDAHVFPGMEGAPVTPLQLPLASLTGGLPAAAPPGASASSATIPSSQARGSWATGVLVESSYGSGTPVWAVGHSLVGPGAEWPPLVSFGNVARVLRGADGVPTMIIATTTTHAGGSGGALLDAAGRLVGLVTSNARHAGGATLPP
eukprot:XP_001693985.1 predicted protein [Chlamydomonas reinhardtii]